MKYLRNFNEKFFWQKDKPKVEEVTGKDNQKVTDIFNEVKENFDIDKLSRIDTHLYGYYFRYKLNDKTEIEVGLHSFNISENGGKFEKLSIDRNIQDEIINFFEGKGKGEIRPDPL